MEKVANNGAESSIISCTVCGSHDIYEVSVSDTFAWYQCKDCKKRFSIDKQPLERTETNGAKWIEHFGVRVKIAPRNRLTRENYATPTNRLSSSAKYYLKQMIKAHMVKIPNETYKGRNTYTDDYVKKQYTDCMRNFDLNIAYFNTLDKNQFDNTVDSFCNKNRFKEITNLNDCNNKSGIYMLVLGEYKQVYIGISKDVKKRIMSHWNSKKEFDRLIFGSPETSIISIDSFGVLDTTKIFFRGAGWYDLHGLEEKLVSKFDEKFLLNRVAGGINSEPNQSMRFLKLFSSSRQRHM